MPVLVARVGCAPLLAARFFINIFEANKTPLHIPMPLPNETAEEYEIPTIVDIIKKQLKAPKKNIAKLFIYAPPFCMVATDMDTNVSGTRLPLLVDK
jgi:hypothetical protein